tara:strand:- start:1649 stop:2740 length:1092 start_codon:yes stop_codon:yes gene_type:complete
MNSSEKFKFFIFILYSLVFLIITTNYLSLNDLIFVANQNDITSYIPIAEKSPLLPRNNEIIIQHVAQRFFIPYIVGLFSKILNLDIFITYKIFTFLFILFLIYIIFFIAKEFNFNIYESILFFSLFFFNPYLIRHHLFNPVQAHDLIFYLLCFTFSFGIIKNNNKFKYISSLSSILIRQTGIAMIIGFIVDCIFKKKISSINFILFLLIFFIISFTTSKIGHYISIKEFYFKYAYGIIEYDFSKISELTRFLFLPLVSFFPLLIFLLCKVKMNIDKTIIVTLLITSLLMIGQPIAAGPDGSGRNIVRIASLCYPILITLLFYTFELKKIYKNKILFILFIVGLHFWSLHPTFSKIKFFSIIRF